MQPSLSAASFSATTRRMRDFLRSILPAPIKTALKPAALAFERRLRTAARRRMAMSYYSPTLRCIREWAPQDTEDANFYYDLEPLNRTHLSALLGTLLCVPAETIGSYFAELDGDEDLRLHVAAGLPRDAKVFYARRLGWYAIARHIKPRLIVETGVDHGVGSCVLASALLRNGAGRYVGIDIRPEAGALLSGRYARAGEIICGDGIETLRAMQGPIDMLVNDSDHSPAYEAKEYAAAGGKLGESAIILSDNAHCSDSLVRFSRENGRPFAFFAERPLRHWYPGAGIGISLPPR